MLSGLGAFVRTFQKVDPSVKVKLEAKDGAKTTKHQRVATLSGSLQSLLIGERTALNIVQRCAGMATAAEESGQDHRVDATRPCSHGNPCHIRPGLLEQDRDLGRLGLGEQVDDPLRVRTEGTGVCDVGSGQRGIDHEAARDGVQPIQDPSKEAQLGVGL